MPLSQLTLFIKNNTVEITALVKRISVQPTNPAKPL